MAAGFKGKVESGAADVGTGVALDSHHVVPGRQVREIMADKLGVFQNCVGIGLPDSFVFRIDRAEIQGRYIKIGVA